MAETLGSLCDKLTIVKRSLEMQQRQLQQEIDDFMVRALDGSIPSERLTFSANKVYKADNNAVANVQGTIGQILSRLAEVNCKLWHEVEKGYEIEKVPPAGKDDLIRQLAVLNLERNRCIDQIDQQLLQLIEADRHSP
jgi:hypothetical protein